jgi:hypothetical protein
MLVEQNTKEKVAQSRRENQKKYLKELLARYETVATKIEVMAVCYNKINSKFRQ